MTPVAPLHGTVLIVDDTPDSLRFLATALESIHLTVLIATSGEAAMALLDNIVPDLILMDAVMPGMGGFAATSAIKDNPAWAHIPVIFMTGLTDSESVVRGFDSGATDYVRKPINVDELQARVRVHMSGARAIHASQAGLDATGRMLMAINHDAALLWCTPMAEQRMSAHAPDWPRDSGILAEPFHGMARRLITNADSPGASVKREVGPVTLELVLVAQHRELELLVRLNELNPSMDIARLQHRHALTQREAEVLLWISYGKPNRVISEILDISPRTVNKHLEQIFEKLGVETRAAAAAVAVRTTSS